jgi:ammonia channel protein AmtB
VQLKGIGFVAVFAPVATFVILTVLKLVFGSLRVSDEEEVEGLDLSQHLESAYSSGGGSLGGAMSSEGLSMAMGHKAKEMA